jgi:hypothetical protein
MNKIELALKSRTFWTIVIIAALNTIPQVKQYLPQSLFDAINWALGFLATYFHVNPSQNYGAPAPTQIPLSK